jgi:hypothetical protein
MQGGVSGKAGQPIGGKAGWHDPWSYWVDAAQRSILFWDVLRQRGNQAVELAQEGEPPVMAFRYEQVMDGRDLARPVNYQLLRLEPPAGFAIDPTKRPYMWSSSRALEPALEPRPRKSRARSATSGPRARRAHRGGRRRDRGPPSRGPGRDHRDFRSR